MKQVINYILKLRFEIIALLGGILLMIGAFYSIQYSKTSGISVMPCSMNTYLFIFAVILILIALVSFIATCYNGSSKSIPFMDSVNESKLDELLNKSNYDPAYENGLIPEYDRLSIQAEKVRDFDIDVIKKGIDLCQNSNNLYAIDLGCANGHVTIDRFSHFSSNFKEVWGIDKESTEINKAISNAENLPRNTSHFVFKCMDIEGPEFKSFCKEQAGKFDVVFTALSLHHMSEPVCVLDNVRWLLRDGGVIIARGADDGSKIAYPEEANNYLKAVIKYTISSARDLSDRWHGRKLPSFLKSADFTNVTMFYYPQDTLSLNTKKERDDFFLYSFGFRLAYFQKQLDTAKPHEKDEMKQKFERMKKLLSCLRRHFRNEEMYYCQIAYTCIGIKNGREKSTVIAVREKGEKGTRKGDGALQ